MSDQDLSHVFANSDLDEAQENHDALPHELRMHIAMGFAHAAGLAPHPGVYKGPAPTIPTDASDSEQDAEGQKTQNQSQAIANVADFNNIPEIPATGAAQKSAPKPSSPSPSKTPNWDDLSGS